MIRNRDDMNRPLDARDDPFDPRETRTSRSAFGWGLALLAAVLIIGGIVLFSSGDNRTSTASNDHGTITTNAPTQTPPPIPKQ